MLASITAIAHDVGYPLLFVLVMAESGGLPVPGETALIGAAVLAASGRLEIAAVIPIAAAAAIAGDNLGYAIGRKGGRWLLQRPGAFGRQRREVLRVGEPFFARHGPKAVFFGRFILGLRVWASWLAGATRMRWPSFLLWNALGGITWATGIGLLAYFLGHNADSVLEAFGVWGLVAAAIATVTAVLSHRRNRSRPPVTPERRGGEGQDRREARPAGSAEPEQPAHRRNAAAGREPAPRGGPQWDASSWRAPEPPRASAEKVSDSPRSARRARDRSGTVRCGSTSP